MHKRVTLTPKQKVQKMISQNGACFICGEMLVKGNIDYDHLTEVWERPEKPYTKEEEYEGQKAVCNDPCHKVKTRKSAARRAHHNRLEKARHALLSGVPKKVKAKIGNGSKWEEAPGMKKQIGTGRMVKR